MLKDSLKVLGDIEFRILGNTLELLKCFDLPKNKLSAVENIGLNLAFLEGFIGESLPKNTVVLKGGNISISNQQSDLKLSNVNLEGFFINKSDYIKIEIKQSKIDLVGISGNFELLNTKLLGKSIHIQSYKINSTIINSQGLFLYTDYLEDTKIENCKKLLVKSDKGIYKNVLIRDCVDVVIDSATDLDLELSQVKSLTLILNSFSTDSLNEFCNIRGVVENLFICSKYSSEEDVLNLFSNLEYTRVTFIEEKEFLDSRRKTQTEINLGTF